METLVETEGSEYGCEFHHVQMYVDRLASLEEYKALEAQLNGLAQKGSFDPFSGGMRFLEPNNALPSRVAEGARQWESLCSTGGKFDHRKEEDFRQNGQDIVEQLIVGLGWRVTAQHVGKGTRSVLVTSQDARGVKIVVTTALESDGGSGCDTRLVYDHFEKSNVDRFLKTHHGYQGVGVLGFELSGRDALEATFARYQKLHPRLLLGKHAYEDKRTVARQTGDKVEATEEVVLGTMFVVEAFAYYTADKNSEADRGTVLRFVAREGSFGARDGFGNPQGVLPGLEHVEARFDGTSIPAYSDHWVSNVTDRQSFLDTLNDVLGFTPKVDFNAGVVAAGRARIESTVTGNSAGKNKATTDAEAVLRDQSQVYLPINNALSDVGHVHGFLEQLGQGVQHLASRVKDLVAFIERVNNYRKITGRGFTFLNIPRSYYGCLDASRDLQPVLGDDPGLAEAVFGALRTAELCTVVGIVKIDVTPEEIRDALVGVPGLGEAHRDAVCRVVGQARYSNLRKLLGDHLCEETLLQVVRHKILVDVQAGDILFQIFTCNIMQRQLSDEAPFLEFIQRVCSQKRLPDGSPAPIKPGCGGFGSRNFIALFLSIEVSKAMQEVEDAVQAGDADAEANARARVDLFTRQLDESGPILTAISDAMSAEGEALDQLELLVAAGKDATASETKDPSRVQELQAVVETQRALKVAGTKQLVELSERYAKRMEALSR